MIRGCRCEVEDVDTRCNFIIDKTCRQSRAITPAASPKTSLLGDGVKGPPPGPLIFHHQDLSPTKHAGTRVPFPYVRLVLEYESVLPMRR
ncbi:hypothetical protein EVAR_90715_1 [Eumeta japonica]|uniref:Uncharacterized protein n=1 Tax=Eumeta variegata TaxID=151549 RepID=A0A4C1ZJF6_EUMVA|nr:hypothetical protein EVAR_90715_1 [Eumeta japonica]